jgi:hypothetical protein
MEFSSFHQISAKWHGPSCCIRAAHLMKNGYSWSNKSYYKLHPSRKSRVFLDSSSSSHCYNLDEDCNRHGRLSTLTLLEKLNTCIWSLSATQWLHSSSPITHMRWPRSWSMAQRQTDCKILASFMHRHVPYSLEQGPHDASLAPLQVMWVGHATDGIADSRWGSSAFGARVAAAAAVMLIRDMLHGGCWSSYLGGHRQRQSKPASRPIPTTCEKAPVMVSPWNHGCRERLDAF